LLDGEVNVPSRQADNHFSPALEDYLIEAVEGKVVDLLGHGKSPDGCNPGDIPQRRTLGFFPLPPTLFRYYIKLGATRSNENHEGQLPRVHILTCFPVFSLTLGWISLGMPIDLRVIGPIR
jgi:hypothetical protein